MISFLFLLIFVYYFMFFVCVCTSYTLKLCDDASVTVMFVCYCFCFFDICALYCVKNKLTCMYYIVAEKLRGGGGTIFLTKTNTFKTIHQATCLEVQ